MGVIDKWLGRFINKAQERAASVEQARAEQEAQDADFIDPSTNEQYAEDEDEIEAEFGAFGTALKEQPKAPNENLGALNQSPMGPGERSSPLDESIQKARLKLTFDERGKRFALSIPFRATLESLDAGGRSRAADSLLTEALLVCPDTGLRQTLAKRLLHRGDRDAARPLLEQLKEYPEHASFALMALGELYDARQDHNRALAMYEKVLAIDITSQQAKVRARRLRAQQEEWHTQKRDDRAQLTRFLGAKAAGSRYAVLEEIGRGGAATVFRAQDRLVDREVALKIYHPRGRAEERRARLVHEARVAGRFDHPHIVPILDIDPERDLLVMALCNAGSLRQILKTKTRLGTRRATELGTVLLRTLGDIHEVGQMHLDVKPSNLLFHDERLMVADFGTAGLRELGAAGGTRAYMAPEHQRRGEVSHKSDLYAAGLVIFESLEGHLPRSASELTLTSTSGPKKRALESVLKSLLEEDPGARADKGKEVAERLLLAASLPISDVEGSHLLEHLQTVARGDEAAARLKAHPISGFLHPPSV